MLVNASQGTDYRPQYDDLRRGFLHSAVLRATVNGMEDRWDIKGRSTYYDLWLPEQLAGTFRMTRGNSLAGTIEERGVIQDWTRGTSPLPWGSDVIDVSRVSNDEAVQDCGLYGAEFLLALAWASKVKGVSKVCAIVKKDLIGPQRTLLRTGFVPIRTARPLLSYDVPGQAVEVVAMCYDLTAASGAEVAAYNHSNAKLKGKDVEFPEFRLLAKALKAAV